MTWVKLDDRFWASPKVLAAGNAAAGAFTRLLSYCGDQETDGAIPGDVVAFVASADEIRALIAHGLIEEGGPEDGSFLIPDFLDYNPSREENRERRAARAEAGRRGGKAGGRGRSKGAG